MKSELTPHGRCQKKKKINYVIRNGNCWFFRLFFSCFYVCFCLFFHFSVNTPPVRFDGTMRVSYEDDYLIQEMYVDARQMHQQAFASSRHLHNLYTLPHCVSNPNCGNIWICRFSLGRKRLKIFQCRTDGSGDVLKEF